MVKYFDEEWPKEEAILSLGLKMSRQSKAERQAKIQKAKEQRELMETLKIFFITIGVIVVGGAIVVASIYYSRLG